MFRILLIFFLLTYATFITNAQDWEKRHAFAKIYFGISGFVVPSLVDGYFLDSNDAKQTFKRSGFVSPAINIGATHFWGYADFYVSINTTDLKFKRAEPEHEVSLGTFTGLRVYPLPSKENSVRPYVGYKFSPFRYKQNNLLGSNFKYTQVKSVFDVGLSFQLPNFYFTIEYSRVANPAFETYLSKTKTVTDRFPSQFFQIGLNYTLETTKSANNETNKKGNQLFSKSNRAGLFLGIGPSSAFPVQSSEYIKEVHPFLDDRSFPNIFPDVALGYHFTKTDFTTAISFRAIKQKRSAFGFEQVIKRKSVILEMYKFMLDYHGFVPYVGLGLSYDRIHLSETNHNVDLTNLTTPLLSPAVVFGWDIRPSEKGDWWILRTNLRYYPFLSIKHQQKKLSLQHVEFNFIQFVVYPQRLKLYKNTR